MIQVRVPRHRLDGADYVLDICDLVHVCGHITVAIVLGEDGEPVAIGQVQVAERFSLHQSVADPVGDF
jgi:hypothetical protein